MFVPLGSLSFRAPVISNVEAFTPGAVLANATRLLNDARILADHHSFATAFASTGASRDDFGTLRLLLSP